MFTGAAQSTLQDIKVPEYGGGYAFTPLCPATRNRYLFWFVCVCGDSRRKYHVNIMPTKGSTIKNTIVLLPGFIEHRGNSVRNAVFETFHVWNNFTAQCRCKNIFSMCIRIVRVYIAGYIMLHNIIV